MDLAHAPVIRPTAQSRQLSPDSPVIVRHRGGPPVHDKFDGEDWFIPGPGDWTLRYDAAVHLKARAVVPGSRNPATGKQQSQLAIVATAWGDPIDAPDRCTPFTPEQIKLWWSKLEAIDRASMASPAARAVVFIGMEEAQATLLSQGMNVDGIVDGEAARGGEIATPVPPEANEALREIRSTVAEAVADGHHPADIGGMGRRRR